MRITFFANTDWYLYNFRRSLAAALREAGHEVVLISPPGPYGKTLQDMGFRWIPAPMERRSLNPVSELALLLWLWRTLRFERPDIVHGFTIKCAIYGGLVGSLIGAARIHAVAGMGYVFISDSIRARTLRPLVRLLMRIALGGGRAKLILQNPDDVALFERAGIVAPEQIKLIPGSGVDCTRFTAPCEHGLSKTRDLRVLLAARLLWDKGVEEFVEAARILKSENRAIRFLLAGAPDSGNPATVPEEVISRWQSAGLIEWLGHVDDMPSLLAGADIVALPSYREGLPKTLIEAASCARPLVTTNVPGCRSVVTHEVDGLLVPARDPQALARAIARLQDDPKLARRLGLAARQRALAEFDEKVVIARTLEVYGEAMAYRMSGGRG